MIRIVFCLCLLLFRAPNLFAADARPNIIFIMLDDMGPADLGCYGSKAIETPNVDRLAAEGIRFTRAYAGCSVCAPTRSTLMTGKHMGHTTVRANPGGVSLLASDVTAAQLLKQAGYATGGFGKWGIADLDTPGVPERHGSDETICAVITPLGAPPTLEEVRDHLRGTGMSATYWPERLELIDVLPRTVTGKVRKTELRERLTRSRTGE